MTSVSWFHWVNYDTSYGIVIDIESKYIRCYCSLFYY